MCSRQGFSIQFCYDINLGSENVVQSYCTHFIQRHSVGKVQSQIDALDKRYQMDRRKEGQIDHYRVPA